MKYYAVKNGRKNGVFKTWDECKEQVSGFSGAIYKSFTSEKEANDFVYGNQINSTDEKTTDNKNNTLNIYPFAYVDGSYNPKTKVYGYGGFISREPNDFIIVQGNGKDIEMATMRNVAGEILGSTAAIKKAVELGLKEINIYYDYIGIEKWVSHEWKAKKKWTQEYVKEIEELSSKIKINFIHVKGHSGIEGNEKADKLAKEAVEI